MIGRARIGTAGWAIPRHTAAQFPVEGSSLSRYASMFNAVEINSTFRRTHKPKTLERWAATTPGAFSFAVKAPKSITHELRLVGAQDLVRTFVEEISVLGTKLGPILIQIPPSLPYDHKIASAFFKLARAHIPGELALEPRHPSWFEDEADKLLASFAVARVAVDPARVPRASVPGGASHFIYYRLHGAPQMYYSAYQMDFLARLAAKIAEAAANQVWCIFDNTASGAAIGNALNMKQAFD